MQTHEQLTENNLALLRNSIREKIHQLKGQKIVVVGDIGLDEYVMGDVRRISPEAPVPVVEVERQDSRLGLAANVAQNVASLGGEPWLVSVIGQDPAGQQLQEQLQKSQVTPSFLVIDPHRPTTRKLRIMAEQHHIVRVDFETRQFLQDQKERELLSRLSDLIPKSDGVILEDYAKGTLSEKTIQEIVKISKKSGQRVIVDPNRSTPTHYYRGVDLLTPNRDETLALSGLSESAPFAGATNNQGSPDNKDHDFLTRAGRRLKKQVGASHLVVTRGKEGMTLLDQDQIVHLPTYARQVFDVTGAGDTVVAALALAWGSGWSLPESCVLANYAAGVVVSKIGSVPCHVSELLSYMNQHN